MAAIYGNYKGYQGATRTTNGRHLAAHVPDPRLTRLSDSFPNLFPSSRILDIGCNSGRTTVDCALHFSAASVHGIDIDPSLINAAKSHLSFMYSRVHEDDVSYFPISSVLEHHHIPYPTPSDPTKFPRNVTFATGDVLDDENVVLGEESYDVVLMLSVVKWIHIHGGDDGLMQVWKKVVNSLVPGTGKLVVEWQEWESYEKAIKKVPALKEKIRTLESRPDGFTETLEGLGMRVVTKVLDKETTNATKKGAGKDEMEVDAGAGSGKEARRGIWVFEKV